MKTNSNQDKQITEHTVLTSIDEITQELQIWQVATVMVLSVLLVSWFKHDRLSSYWQQTYQQADVWTALNQLPYWKTGLLPQHYTDPSLMMTGLADFNHLSNSQLNQLLYADILAERQQQEALKAQRLAQMQERRRLEAEEARKPKVMTEVQIMPEQKVFFAGDSMMEGVAPWAMRELQSKYQIASIDLSKQNTGLSYSSFFDWPATVEKTIADNPDIGVMVMLLGANDPWAVPDPEHPGATYIKFGSPKWNELYSQKIQRILQAADNHQVQVMWLTPPAMKSDKLKEDMEVLTKLYHQVIPNTQAVLLDTKPMLLDDANSNLYSDSMTIEGKKIKVRTADGIHFTPTGQKRLAAAIVSHIKVLSDTTEQ
ncbi:SGNH/GDSL hydrolase family protein [Psychrobacter sp. I-STPA10]|uniref:SGNH/GDSL hydrolase family protein n=1 Tax=Psychrobacter sp. I-STPA10 TaxID=2585769 RepID=UPI001E4A58EA|nr:DUF459 domain-containing protein [Psychrobacter sp. I-STPA10]